MLIEVDDDFKRKIAEELTSGFIYREYEDRCPRLTAADFSHDKAVELYRIDVYFRSRVEHLVSGVMGIIGKHM